jgi:hypothetical protein
MRALVAARHERAVTALGSRGNAARSLPVTEAEARAALRDFVAVAGVERWIAGQPWEAVPGGWRVPADFDGWRFWLEHVTDGVRVIMSVREGERADWIVPAR